MSYPIGVRALLWREIDRVIGVVPRVRFLERGDAVRASSDDTPIVRFWVDGEDVCMEFYRADASPVVALRAKL